MSNCLLEEDFLNIEIVWSGTEQVVLLIHAIEHIGALDGRSYTTDILLKEINDKWRTSISPKTLYEVSICKKKK